MRTLRMLLPALLVGLVLPVTVSAPATPVPPTPTLVGIRAAHHPGYDRIVFDFRNGVPGTVRVRFVDRLVADPSGLPVRISGRGILKVVFTPAKAHDASGPTAPARTQYALPNIMTAVRAGDFEGYTTYGIGLARKTSFHVFTLRDPARVVIDVRAAFRTVQRPVWFFDVDNFVANHRPFFRSVQRPVPATAPGVGVLDRLFAGPLPAERANGLRLLRSGATGFTRLSIADQVARVHLTGACSSGGSTVTVAGEIMPTLRAFDTVRWVKIYDQDGQTEHPTGHSDSIPTCLEP